MTTQVAILNLFASHGVLADEQDIDKIRVTIRGIPNSVVVEEPGEILWAFPVNSYELFEGVHEFHRDAWAQADAWFVWLAIGALPVLLQKAPFPLSRVLCYRSNKKGDRRLMEYSFKRLLTLAKV